MFESLRGYRIRHNPEILGMIAGSAAVGIGLLFTGPYKDYEIEGLPIPHLYEGTGTGLLVGGGLLFLTGMQKFIRPGTGIRPWSE